MYKYGSVLRFDEQMKAFFALPFERKLMVQRSASNSRGFSNSEYTKQRIDLKEVFDIGHKPQPNMPDDHPANVILDGYNQWLPKEDLPQFRNVTELFYAEAVGLATRLLQVIGERFMFCGCVSLRSDAFAAKGLNLSRMHFEEAFTPHTTFMRLNYYPVPANVPDGSFGTSRHTDAGVLTVLKQDNVSTTCCISAVSSCRA
jgi:isopenicillin N synthase-like dioxygenase